MTDTNPRARVVVGVDGSEPSRIALHRAAEEAVAHDAVLEVVHAWDFLDQPGPAFDPHYGSEKAQARAEAIVAEVTADVPGVDAVVRAVNAHAAQALVDAAEGALMVVVGARGLGGFRGMLLGSVSQHVVHHARCPVLIVR